MNTITEPDRKLAETLRSLSLEPSPNHLSQAKTGSRRPLLIGGLVLGSIIVAILVGRPETLRRTAVAVPNLAAGSATEGRDALATKQARPVVPAREITGTGYVVAPRTTLIFARYEGRITGVAVEGGDTVAADAVLVTLTDAGAGFALDQARAARAAAELTLAAREIAHLQAEVTLRRIAALAASLTASRQKHEDAQSARDMAENAVFQARQALADADLGIRIAEERVAGLTVRAPISGTVTRLNAHVGDTVLSREDSVREVQSLLTITDTDNMVIEAEVAETSIGLLRPGLRGEAVLDGYPEHPFPVEIVRIAPVVSPEKGTVVLRLSLTDPPAGVRPAMAARIRIATDPETGQETQNNDPNHT